MATIPHQRNALVESLPLEDTRAWFGVECTPAHDELILYVQFFQELPGKLDRSRIVRLICRILGMCKPNERGLAGGQREFPHHYCCT